MKHGSHSGVKKLERDKDWTVEDRQSVWNWNNIRWRTAHNVGMIRVITTIKERLFLKQLLILKLTSFDHSSTTFVSHN